MKKIYYIFFVFILIGISIPSRAQIMKKLQKTTERAVKKEANRKATKYINKGVKKGSDAAEKAIIKKSKEKEKEVNEELDSNPEVKEVVEDAKADATKQETKASAPTVVWSKFDFVPGETIIFYDLPSSDEENGEFPSRWDYYKGNFEIMEVDGETVIGMITAGYISPYMKNRKEDYLPDVFTLEFDAYFTPNVYNQRYYIEFYDLKEQRSIRESIYNYNISVYVNGIECENQDNSYPGKARSNRDPQGGWKHISIAYTKGKLKVYMDDTRLINIPHMEGNPVGISIGNSFGSDMQFYIKNVRLAKGGVKYYDRVETDGKIIMNGIKFDVNKATLRPESMGSINKIYAMMKKDPSLNFSVEGHTDSDGSAERNLELSKQRAKTVMDKLISMGIDASRLKYTGYGDKKPLESNSTPEGRANNRRVEFVKF